MFFHLPEKIQHISGGANFFPNPMIESGCLHIPIFACKHSAKKDGHLSVSIVQMPAFSNFSDNVRLPLALKIHLLLLTKGKEIILDQFVNFKRHSASI